MREPVSVHSTERMPMELQLDLLVDGELAEDQRKALLLRLNDEPPGPWRDLGVRFLQRQMEREGVRQLMAGGSVVPATLLEEPRPVAGRVWRRLSWTMSIAAGLLIVAISAMVTFYLVRPAPSVMTAGEFEASIPGELVSYDRNVKVTVPVVNLKGGPDIFNNQHDPRLSRQSWVIQPDGQGNAVVIPMNTMKATIQ